MPFYMLLIAMNLASSFDMNLDMIFLCTRCAFCSIVLSTIANSYIASVVCHYWCCILNDFHHVSITTVVFGNSVTCIIVFLTLLTVILEPLI